MIIHLTGGPRDGDTLDLDEPHWCLTGELTQGILPAAITLDPFPGDLTSYDLVRAEPGEGWYQFNESRTTAALAQLEAPCPHRPIARREL